MAHHEALLGLRVLRLRDLPGLQGLPDQGVLRELLPPHVRRHVRRRQPGGGGAPEQRRAMARDARRHRRRDRHRRAPQTGAFLRRRRRRVLLHLRRRGRGRRSREAARVPSRPGHARDGDGSSAARPVRGARGGRRPDRGVPREAARRRRLDQRRILRALAPRRRLRRGRSHGLGAGAAAAACGRRRNCRRTGTTASGSRWTRCARRTTSSSCGQRDGRRGRCGSRTRLLARQKGPRHRADRLQGELALPVARARSAPTSAGSRTACRRPRRCTKTQPSGSTSSP